MNSAAHQPQEFARLYPRAAAIGRSLVAPPPGGAPATIIDDQTKTRHRAGQPVRGCDASMPAHREWGPEFLLTRVGSPSKRFSLALALPRSTGRPFGVGSFRATRLGCNRALASINDAADHLLNHRSDRFPRHFVSPSLRRIQPSDGDREACSLNRGMRLPR